MFILVGEKFEDIYAYILIRVAPDLQSTVGMRKKKQMLMSIIFIGVAGNNTFELSELNISN